MIVTERLRKKRLLRIAEFIGNLPRRKLRMGTVAVTRKILKRRDAYGDPLFSIEPKDMNPHQCKSVACVMGWMPWIDRRHFGYVGFDSRDEGEMAVQLVRGPGAGFFDYMAMMIYLDIPEADASQLFGCGRDGYRTPKQVAKGLRHYAETGELPEVLR